MNYFLGIDGGGTKTKAAVCDDGGKIICRVTGETINFYSVGMSVCRENLKAIMSEIEQICGASFFKAAVIGCSALDGEADEKTTQALCGDIINSQKIYMNSDAFIPLMSAECDAVAICGTGSMAVALDENKNTITAGGWGHILGDEGSAYAIAVSALKLCCEYTDKSASHPLLECAKNFFGVNNLRKVIDYIYAPATTKADIAKFSAQIDALAQQGCEAAVEIIKYEAQKYSKTVVALLNRTNACGTLALYGGVFENSEIFRTELSQQVNKVFPSVNIQLLKTSPEEIALDLAREMQ